MWPFHDPASDADNYDAWLDEQATGTDLFTEDFVSPATVARPSRAADPERPPLHLSSSVGAGAGSPLQSESRASGTTRGS